MDMSVSPRLVSRTVARNPCFKGRPVDAAARVEIDALIAGRMRRPTHLGRTHAKGI